MNEPGSGMHAILFEIILGFSALNLVVNAILLRLYPKKIYRLLCLYWLFIFVCFTLNLLAGQRPFAVIMTFGLELAPIIIFSYVMFDSLQQPFFLRRYLGLYLVCCLLSAALFFGGAPFTIAALPFALLNAAPVVHAALLVFVRARRSTTPLQKLYGAISICIAVQCLNFALFRMQPGTEVWGWAVTFALAQVLSIILPAFALDELGRRERSELEKMVALRTDELAHASAGLQQSFQANKSLLRTVLHDISNPLFMVIAFQERLRTFDDPENDEALAKIKTSSAAIREVIDHVRELEIARSGMQPISLGPVDLERCIDDVRFLLRGRLLQKRVELAFHNGLGPGRCLLAEYKSFTYSVLNNIISNSLNFSFPGSRIVLSARAAGPEEVVLEIQDSGTGIADDILANIFDATKAKSRIGTQGEMGSGFGMPLAKFYVTSYGGAISIESRDIDRHPDTHGTKISITLKSC